MNEENRQVNRPDSAGRPADERSLRDLFAAARKDARPTLLQRQDAQDLIRNSETTVLHRLDLKQGWVRRNLLSSPIRIGVTLMTTSAFASLMVLAVSHFTTTAPLPTLKTPTSAPIALQRSAPQQHTETVVAIAPATRIAHVRSEVHLNPAQLPVSFTAKATDSDTLRAVELSPDQLARLGIELPNDGDIVVYSPGSHGSHSWTFSTRGGMSQSNVASLASSVQASPLPFAITYPMGEALMYTKFSRPGEKPDILIGVNPNVASKYQRHYAELRGENPTDGAVVSFSSTDDSHEPSGRRHSELNAEIRASGGTPSFIVHSGAPVPSAGPGAITILHDGALPPPPPPTATRHDVAASADTAYRHGKRIQIVSTLVVDSTVQQASLPTGLNIDSLIASVSQSGDSTQTFVDVEKIARAIGGMHDSASSMVMIKHVIVDSSNEAHDLMSTPEMMRSIKKLADIVKCDTANRMVVQGMATLSMNPGPPISADSEARGFESYYRRESGDTTSWSSLIPIRVTNYNTPEHHTLIFWYERTPEVMNIVPRSAVERADARPKNVEISVYPNPTQGETNIHYVVKNGEPVTINVVSLLGQKLIEGGARQDQHGDLSLDLSSLEPGVYLLIATLQNGEKAVERVVVTK
jgi:hypothetical protein